MAKYVTLSGLNNENLSIEADKVSRVDTIGGVTTVILSDGTQFKVKATPDAARAALFDQPPPKEAAATAPPSDVKTDATNEVES
jgi:hypothetical protein